MKIQAQDLSSHQWEDRLILILTDDTSNTTYQDQIEELYADPEGLEDRKLVIYTILPDRFSRYSTDELNWVLSNELYSEYKTRNNSFEVLLIGLDAGVKLRQAEVLSNEKIFGRIDQMPMRRRELQSQGG